MRLPNAGRMWVFIRVSIHASVKDATPGNYPGTFPTLVSIHASVKDATPHNLARLIGFFVSIHASVKDATESFGQVQKVALFQSTHL